MKKLSAGRAFVLNAGFVGGLLLLSQLPLLEQRPMVRTSIVGAALFLLAWSGLLFGVLRRTVTLDVVPRRQHYLQACQQGGARRSGDSTSTTWYATPWLSTNRPSG